MAVSNSVNTENFAVNCSSLTGFIATNFAATLDIRASRKIQHPEAVTILNNLATLSSGQSATVYFNTCVSQGLSTAEKAIAENKGWTVS